MYFHE